MTNDVQVEDSKPSQLDGMIDDLRVKLESYSSKVTLIANLQAEDKFKLLSKQSRNALLHGLLGDAADIEELTKITFRALKKVKRERVPEDVIDGLLGVPDNIRNNKSDFDNQPFGSNLEE